MLRLRCWTFLFLTASAGMANAAGDAAKGRALYQARCIACHAVDVSMAGPSHRGVFGRRAGQVADFAYSAALQRSRVMWKEATLERWLADPEKFIPGQKMNVAVTSAQERADLIAYLKSLSVRTGK